MIAQLAKQVKPTKRTIVSLAVKCYDPLGIISPIIVHFKLIVQELCKMKVNWDEPLQGELMEEWNKLQQVQPITIARCYFNGVSELVISHSLIGFCDASLKLYAAVIYLKIQTASGYSIRLVSSKTSRLELLAALLLAKLISSVHHMRGAELALQAPLCVTDSTVALRSQNKETVCTE